MDENNTSAESNPPIALIVDDSVENLKVLGNVLKNKQCQIVVADSGEMALALIAKRKPDIILLDITMPYMDGYEVCRKIKANPDTSEIPVIFLTARTEKEEIVKGFNIGAVDYITKPFYPEELLSRVMTHIELKRQKELLKVKNEELKKINFTKDKLFSIIGHDLKNPIAGLLGLFKVMANEMNTLSPEDLSEFSSTILTTLKNIQNMLQGLLQWSLLHTGGFKINPEKFMLNPIAEEVIAVLAINASEKKIIIQNNIPGEIWVFSDATMVKTIIHNLLNNSIKFTNRGGKIEITAWPSADAVSFSVKDNGIGMAAEQVEGLFNPEAKIRTEGTEGEKGTGLGLGVVFEMVNMAGGKIKVKSEEEKGAEFEITLPNLYSL
jgi:signal transduction histidine kinase